MADKDDALNDSEMLEDNDTEMEDVLEEETESESGDDEGKARRSYKEELKALQAEFEATKKALAERNKENQKRRKQIKDWEALGVEPDTVKTLLEQQEQKEMQEAEKKGEFEKIKAKILEESEKRLQEKDAEIQTMRQSLESHLVDANISAAILQNDGVPELLQHVIKAQTRLVSDEGKYRTVVVDENGEARINEKGDYMTVAELVSEFKEHPSYGMAFKAPNVKGMGTSPKGVGDKTNPSKSAPKKPRSQMSKKEQQEYIREYGIDKYMSLPLK